jgi:hypothetical protein
VLDGVGGAVDGGDFVEDVVGAVLDVGGVAELRPIACRFEEPGLGLLVGDGGETSVSSLVFIILLMPDPYSPQSSGERRTSRTRDSAYCGCSGSASLAGCYQPLDLALGLRVLEKPTRRECLIA